MKRWPRRYWVKTSGGYTIVEAMIFLAVSGAIAVSAMTSISGQQRKTEFIQAVRDFETTLQDIANDVSTGTTATKLPSGQTCKINAGASATISISSGISAGQERCIFIARAIKFSADSSYEQYTVVGRQHDPATGKESASLAEAVPRVLPSPYIEQATWPGGLKVKTVTCADCGPPTTVGVIGFFTTFKQYTSGSLETGSSNVDLIPVEGSALTMTSSGAQTALTTLGNLTKLNPARGLDICVDSGGTNQHAVVSLGGQAGQLRVSSTVLGGLCP